MPALRCTTCGAPCQQGATECPRCPCPVLYSGAHGDGGGAHDARSARHAREGVETAMPADVPSTPSGTTLNRYLTVISLAAYLALCVLVKYKDEIPDAVSDAVSLVTDGAQCMARQSADIALRAAAYSLGTAFHIAGSLVGHGRLEEFLGEYRLQIFYFGAVVAISIFGTVVAIIVGHFYFGNWSYIDVVLICFVMFYFIFFVGFIFVLVLQTILYLMSILLLPIFIMTMFFDVITLGVFSLSVHWWGNVNPVADALNIISTPFWDMQGWLYGFACWLATELAALSGTMIVVFGVGYCGYFTNRMLKERPTLQYVIMIAVFGVGYFGYFVNMIMQEERGAIGHGGGGGGEW